MEEIRIYVADLAAYNNGKLHGVWIEACSDMHDIWKAVSKMLKSSPEQMAEEYAIHDYEGFRSSGLNQTPRIRHSRLRGVWFSPLERI